MAKYKVGFRYNDGKQEYEITKILNFSSISWYECLHIGSNPEMYYTVSEETVDRLTVPRIARSKFEIGARVNDGYCSGTVVKINVGEILGKTTTSYEVELDMTEGSQRLITCEYHEDELEFGETKYKPIVPNETTIAAVMEARGKEIQIQEESAVEVTLPLGRKFDADKTQYRLVPPLALKEVADVLTFGAKKYEENNWKHVDNLQKRYLDAAMRHIEDYRMGNSKDPESNLHHLAHAICCLMFKIEIYKEGENE